MSRSPNHRYASAGRRAVVAGPVVAIAARTKSAAATAATMRCGLRPRRETSPVEAMPSSATQRPLCQPNTSPDRTQEVPVSESTELQRSIENLTRVVEKLEERLVRKDVYEPARR